MKVQGEKQDWSTVQTGVRLGSMVLFFLFGLIMDKCIKALGQNEDGEKTLAYVDDLMIMTDSRKESIQQSLDAILS